MNLSVELIRTDGGTQSRAEINPQTVKDYAEDIKRGDAFPPLLVMYDGADYWLYDGFHRLDAHVLAGHESVECKVDQGTQRDAILKSLGVNRRHGLRRTNADKRRAVMRMLEDEEWGKWSDREIARRCGVSHMTVSRGRSLSQSDSDRIYTDRWGNESTMKTADIGTKPRYPEVEKAAIIHGVTSPKTIEVMEKAYLRTADGASTDTWDEMSRSGYIQPTGEDDAVSLSDDPRLVEWAMQKKEKLHRQIGWQAKITHVSNNSGNNEWYTPSEFIEAARLVMVTIDLDPASCQTANRTVRATTYHTAEDDGLTKEWRGNVWMNPPYAKPLINQFCKKLRDEVEAGNVTEACVLVNNATETAWFNDLFFVCSAICFVKTRVKFLDPEGKASGSPLQGQCVVYVGSNPDFFGKLYSELGKVLYV